MICVRYVVGTDNDIKIDNQVAADLVLQNTGSEHEFSITVQQYNKEGECSDTCTIYLNSENTIKQLIHGLQVCLDAQKFDDGR